MKSKKAVFAVLIMAGGLASCGSNSYRSCASIKDSGVLNVSTNAEFAPFEYLNGSEVIGVDADIIKAYAESIGVSANIEDMDFDAALTSVSAHHVDCAIAAITKNPEREKTMAFSDAYFRANQVAIVRTDSEYASLSSAEAIIVAFTADEISIGVQRGTTGEAFVDDELPGDKAVSFDNGALACQALSNGQIDAVIIDLEPAKLYCKNFSAITYLAPVLTEEEYAIAIAQGNGTLLDSINAFIAAIKNDGTLEAILADYFGSAS
jgi:polar amino acid transport system substrate-binding protein